jgi:predicted  nucleic acid-binding Zn-ribbon protein
MRRAQTVWISGILCIITACKSAPVSAQQQDHNGKVALALMSWTGTTSSALYGMYQADQLRPVPGDAYTTLANDVARRIETARATRSLVQSPFDLAADALTVGAVVDPEPATKTVTAISAFGVRKFGEAAGAAIYDSAQKTAIQVLAKGLASSGYSAAQLQNMSETELVKAVQDMKIGGQKMSNILKDQPEAMQMLQRHAVDAVQDISAAALLQSKKTSSNVATIEADLIRNTQQLNTFKAETEQQLRALEAGMSNVELRLSAADQSIKQLRTEVEGNTKAIQSLALITSSSWTAAQKRDAIKAGLFPEMGQAEKDAALRVLDRQVEVDEAVAKLTTAAQDLSYVKTIAANLRVDNKVVEAVAKGQAIAEGAAAFAGGRYLAAAASFSSVLGVGGGDGAAARHRQLMQYLDMQFAKVNSKLDEIIERQDNILKGLVAISQQLQAMSKQLVDIEALARDNNVILQNLLQQPWAVCDTFRNQLNAETVTTLAEIRRITDPGPGRAALVSCFTKLETDMVAQFRNPNWAGGYFSIQSMPSDVIATAHVVQKTIEAEKTRRIGAYLSARALLLEYQKQGKPALPLLLRLADPQPDLSGATTRDDALATQAAVLAGFHCQAGVINETLRTLVCQQAPGGTPQIDARLPVLLNSELLGPQVYKTSDIGIQLSQLAPFIFERTATVLDVVDSTALAKVVTTGLTGDLQKAAQFQGQIRVLDGLTWMMALNRLQQSVAYGDFTAQIAFEQLYDKSSRVFVYDPVKATPLQKIAVEALRANDVLARNVVLLGLRDALSSMAPGNPNFGSYLRLTNYALGIEQFKAPAACDASSDERRHLMDLLPGWSFDLRVDVAQKTQAEFAPCASVTDDQKTPGLYANIAGIPVKVPSAQAIKTGMFEVPPSLLLANRYWTLVAVRRAEADIGSLVASLPKIVTGKANSFDVAAQLLSSKCLSVQCSSVP